MKYKVEIWDDVNQHFTKTIDTEVFHIEDEDWFLLTVDEREEFLSEEMYYLTTAFHITELRYAQVL